MTKKLQISTIFVLFLLLALSNMAMVASADVLPSPTPTFVRPKPRVTATRVLERPQPTSSPSQPAPMLTATLVQTKPALSSLGVQAGNSDWIVLIGVLIVAIIVIPLLAKYKEWRAN